MRIWSVLLSALILSLSAIVFSQKSAAKWSVELIPSDVRQGESAQVLLKVDIGEGWWLYGLRDEGGAPRNAQFDLIKGAALEGQGGSIGPKPHTKFDKNFSKQVEYHTGKAVFAIPVKITASPGDAEAKVRIQWQICNERICEIPSDQVFPVKFKVAEGEARPDRVAPVLSVPDQPENPSAGKPDPQTKGSASTDDFASNVANAKSKGLLPFLLLAFTLGLAALLTPCVFPMVPITVSFFSKSSGAERKANYGGAAAYCLGIIASFTALGLIVTLLFGAFGVQDLAANPWVNVFLVLMFIVLSMNLFGMFEITVPAAWLNKLNRQSRSKSIVAPMVMGIVFTLTSFTCTVPFVGTILAGAATTGDFLFPIAGMIAFSTAFSLPFFLLALFPQALSKLPKSGSWLATAKAFLGFVEIAAALKFLSNADLVWQLGFITQPVFLAIWAAIAFIAGLYLLGWLRLGHEDGPLRVGWLRRGFAVATLAAGVLCLAGLQGASLGKLSAFLPPVPYPGKEKSGISADKLTWVPTYKEALAQAKSEGKALFIDFTGVTCTNCRDMENNMFPRKAVVNELSQFARAKLYTDRKTPEDKLNRDLLQKLTQSVSLPVYVIQSPDGETLKVFQGSTNDEEEFVRFLRQGREAFSAGDAEPVASRGLP
ncbi:MAG: cytochrome c biogenesis protein CcdA [Fimbriimonadaceae bacterium]